MSSKPGKFIGISFSLKLGFWYCFFFLICVVALFGFSFHLLEEAAFQRDIEVLDLQASKYTESYNKGGVRLLERRFSEERNSSRNVFFLRVLDDKNRVVSLKKPAQSVIPTPDVFSQNLPKRNGLWTSEDKTNVWTFKEIKLLDGNMLQVGKSSQESREFLNSLRGVFIKTTIPLLFLGLIVGIALTYRAIRPIRNIIIAVQKILKTGEINTRVSVDHSAGKGQLHELVTIINKMLSKNEEVFAAMRNSLDNVAHDLRTPMTRLRGSAESALLSGNDDQIHDSLADCLEESDHVLQMLNTMMDVAEVESGAIKLKLKDVSVKQMIEKIIDLYDIVAEDSNITISTEFKTDITIQADETRIKQVFANLVDNAIKYSPENSAISIVVEKKGKALVVSVKDQGIGIEGEDSVRIFNRLYRADASRTKKGIGLGLSLVKGIVEAHSGRITVSSLGKNKGSTFKVALPITQGE